MLVHDGTCIINSVYDGDCDVEIVLDGDCTTETITDGEYGAFKAISNLPIFEGPYEVQSIPVDEQTVATNGKQMIRDITVKEIHYFETSNPNGTTVFIGGVS